MVTMLAALALAATPAEGVVLAAQDLGRLPNADRYYTRYLLRSDKEHEAQLLTGHTNHLHRSQDIVQLVDIGGKVLRLDIRNYSGWTVALYDSLASSDPFFHVKLSDGRHAIAPILGDGVVTEGKLQHDVKANLAFLVANTQSQAPLLRADWFFNQTAAQFNRKPGYYDFLGVKDEADFHKLIGFDAKLAKDFGKVLRESVSISGVTHQPRAIEIQKAQGGWYLKTFDFAKATDKKNPLRVLGEDIAKQADATEQYGALPNGLWATFLANGKGVRQDSAPDSIASDSHSRSTDRRVHINVSCVRCHTDGGVQPIDGFIRGFAQPPFVVGSADYNAYVTLRREYLKDLTTSLRVARELYSEAVFEATGWTAAKYAASYAAYWEAYEDARVDLAWVARDRSVDVKYLRDLLTRRLAAGYNDPNYGGVDLVLASLLRGNVIGIRQYEEVYGLLDIILKGARP